MLHLDLEVVKTFECMTKNQKFVNQDYTISYSEIAKLKISERQLMFNLTKLGNLHDIVVNTITSNMPQLIQKLPYYDTEHISKIRYLINTLSSNFKYVVVTGMGGAVLNSMCFNNFSNKCKAKIIFSTQICASYLSNVKNSIDLEKTAFIFISNSGDTIETAVAAEYWYFALLNQNITNIAERFVFIYGQKQESLLRQIHTTYGGQFFEYDSKMGGRFSTFTTPHLIVAGLSGIDLDDLFKGANSLLDDFELNNRHLVKELCAGSIFTSYSLNDENIKVVLIGSYNSELDGLTKWYHTAISETFGRQNISILPINLDLPIDQHGLMQAILNNNANKIFNLFTIKDTSNSKIAKAQNIMQSEIVEQFTKAGIPVREFIFENRKSQALGGAMMYLILELIAAAALIDINPYIQPQIDDIKKNIATKYRQYLQQGVP
jgi:glucose-6-phosphate isomerase